MAQLKFKITIKEFKYYFAALLVLLTIGIALYSSLFNDTVFCKKNDYSADVCIDNNQVDFLNYKNNSADNALVYGELKALDPVTFKEIGGEYSHVVKVTEKLKKTVSKNGETIVNWIPIETLSLKSTRTSFLNEEHPYDTIKFPITSYITTKQIGDNIRDVYYGTDVSCMGTVYVTKENGEVQYGRFFPDRNIKETMSGINAIWIPIVFCFAWLFITGVCLQKMYYIHMNIKKKRRMKNAYIQKNVGTENINAERYCAPVNTEYYEEVIYPEEIAI